MRTSTSNPKTKLETKKSRTTLLAVAALALIGSMALAPLMANEAEAEVSDGRFCIGASSDAGAFRGTSGNCRSVDPASAPGEQGPRTSPATLDIRTWAYDAGLPYSYRVTDGSGKILIAEDGSFNVDGTLSDWAVTYIETEVPVRGSKPVTPAIRVEISIDGVEYSYEYAENDPAVILTGWADQHHIVYPRLDLVDGQLVPVE